MNKFRKNSKRSKNLSAPGLMSSTNWFFFFLSHSIPSCVNTWQKTFFVLPHTHSNICRAIKAQKGDFCSCSEWFTLSLYLPSLPLI